MPLTLHSRTPKLKHPLHMSCMVFGATGLCGNLFLEAAQHSGHFSEISSVTRKPLKYNYSRVHSIVEKDHKTFVRHIRRERPTVVFSAIGTTLHAYAPRSFRNIDYGLNYRIARAARAAGVHTFVVISSLGAHPRSPFLYLRSKGRLERDVIALRFPRTIILRPGILLGKRTPGGVLVDTQEFFFKNFHDTYVGNNVFFTVKSTEVAHAAVRLIEAPVTRTHTPTVRVVGPKELIRIGTLY